MIPIKKYCFKSVVLSMVLPFFCAAAGLPGSPNQAKAPGSKPASSNLPIAKIGESLVCCPNDSIMLDGWASIDIGGEVVEWLWDLNGDNKVDTITKTGELVVASPRTPSSYIIHLKVKDNQGNISSADSAIVHVMNSTPLISIGHDTTVKAGIRMHFEPAITVSCGKIIRYEWDFNEDGFSPARKISCPF